MENMLLDTCLLKERTKMYFPDFDLKAFAFVFVKGRRLKARALLASATATSVSDFNDIPGLGFSTAGFECFNGKNRPLIS